MGLLDQVGEVLITEEEIKQRAAELGEQITSDHKDDDVILVGILRGAVMWMTELMKHIKLDITIDFMVCSSYGSSTRTSGVVRIDKDLSSDIKDKSVIIVEDIVDSGVTLTYLKKYLNTRTDKNPALFVSIRNPHKRLLTGGVEIMLKKMGEQCDVHHVHPHKFRRTMATTAIDKGMPIEQVQRLLGHEKIDTTLHYAMVKQSNVKSAHRKYIG